MNILFKNLFFFFINILLINGKLIDTSQKCNKSNYTYWDQLYYINNSNKFNYIGIYSCYKSYLRIENASIHYIETWHLQCNRTIPLNTIFLDDKYECKKKGIIKINKINIGIYSKKELIPFLLFILFIICICYCDDLLNCWNNLFYCSSNLFYCGNNKHISYNSSINNNNISNIHLNNDNSPLLVYGQHKINS